MTTRLSLDRFEGRNKATAVLLTEDGTSINVPKALLPPGARAGDVLSLTLERDDAATRKLAEDTARLQDELSKSDPGGDLKL